MKISKISMSYKKFIQLPDDERSKIESSLVATCKHYLDAGYSIPLSIRKVIIDSPFSGELVEKIIRNNSEIVAKFYMRIQSNKMKETRWK